MSIESDGGGFRRWCAVMILLALVALSDPTSSSAGQGTQSPVTEPTPVEVLGTQSAVARARIQAMSPLKSPPTDATNKFADDPRAAELGQAIFFDPRFSSNGRVSCATCHAPELGFSDGRPLAVGLAVGSRNSPTVVDAAFQRWLTWDGKADSLWAQALHPFLSPVEMGMNRESVVEVLRADPRLLQRYQAVFGELPHSKPGIGRAFANIGKALAAYERRLVSRESAFDRLVRAALGPASQEATTPEAAGTSENTGVASSRDGGDTAIASTVDVVYSDSALRGLLLFVGKAGCHQCHHGPALSDGEFHRLGLADSAGRALTDRGRLDGVVKVMADPCNAAGEFSDDRGGSRAQLVRSLVEDPDLFGRMRTPGLRSVARTAPYMHDGRFATLEDVIRFYSTLEGAILDHHGETVLVPLSLSEGEMADLAAFLRSLDGGPLDPLICESPDWAR